MKIIIYAIGKHDHFKFVKESFEDLNKDKNLEFKLVPSFQSISRKELDKFTFLEHHVAVLCVSETVGRVSLWSNKDPMYNHFLEYANNKLGNNNIIIVICDVQEDQNGFLERILKSDEKVKKNYYKR